MFVGNNINNINNIENIKEENIIEDNKKFLNLQLLIQKERGLRDLCKIKL